VQHSENTAPAIDPTPASDSLDGRSVPELDPAGESGLEALPDRETKSDGGPATLRVGRDPPSRPSTPPTLHDTGRQTTVGRDGQRPPNDTNHTMRFRDWIRKGLGFSDGSQLLDPRVYAREELEEDIWELEYELDQKERQLSQTQQKYDDIIQKGVGAPKRVKRRLAMKADDLERRHNFHLKAYEGLTKRLGLLHAVKTAREMTGGVASDLHVDDLLEEADAREIRTEIRGTLRNLSLQDKEIDKILTTLDFSVEAEATSAPSNTSKHLGRMDELEEADEEALEENFLGDELGTASEEHSPIAGEEENWHTTTDGLAADASHR
jgi:hypothetical protein